MTNMFDAETIEELSWYHGNINRHIAESLLLQNGKEGSYLLRDGSRPNELAVSVRGSAAVKHYQVIIKNGSYHFGLADFSTPVEFIEHFKQRPFVSGDTGIITWLKYPYPKIVNEPPLYEQVTMHAQYAGNESCVGTETLLSASKEGYLIKQGGIVKNWKERWFVLKKDTLSYYKNRTDQRPIRCLDLNECTRCAMNTTLDREHTFSLTFPYRIFNITARSEQEAKDWLDMIQYKLLYKQ